MPISAYKAITTNAIFAVPACDKSIIFFITEIFSYKIIKEWIKAAFLGEGLGAKSSVFAPPSNLRNLFQPENSFGSVTC